MDNMSRIAAISWAAQKRGIGYGTLECQISSDEREAIFQDYRKYKQEELARLPALNHGQAIHPPKQKISNRSKGSYHSGRPCSFDVHTAYELYHKGYNDCKIALALQMSVGAIRHWRCKEGLPPVVPRGRPAQKNASKSTNR